MNQAVATREDKVMSAFELEGIKNQLSSLMQNNPRKIEKFKTKILTLSLTSGLKDCTPESIIHCGLQAVTLDMPLQQGQGYVVKYGGIAQFDLGYKGWQILAKRAGFSVLADAVYNGDTFSDSGYGFDREVTFIKGEDRKPSDDKWARQNLKAVIVSIMEDATKVKTLRVVDADMIHKIIGKSPAGMKGPHGSWADQMFCAKAIKQVMSKFPIDLSASELGDAIDMVNTTETTAQETASARTYTDERFAEVYAAWVDLVESGKKAAMAIITQVSNGFALSPEQMQKLMDLQNIKPVIDGEVVNTETGEVTPEAESKPESEPKKAASKKAQAPQNFYPDSAFVEELAGWKTSIEKGDITAENVVADIAEAGFVFTPDQLKEVEAIGVKKSA